MNKVKILFVCMGNICRSPTAHGVLRQLVQRTGLEALIEIDSAGTHAFHVKSAPDPRAQAAAKARGVDIADLRGRVVCAEDFTEYDYILAMDYDNYNNLMGMCPSELQDRVQLFLEYAPTLAARSVPDPYCSDLDGFEIVLNMVEAAAQGLLEHLCHKYGYTPSAAS